MGLLRSGPRSAATMRTVELSMQVAASRPKGLLGPAPTSEPNQEHPHTDTADDGGEEPRMRRDGDREPDHLTDNHEGNGYEMRPASETRSGVFPRPVPVLLCKSPLFVQSGHTT